MLKLREPQLVLWDFVLPPELTVLSEELTTVDRYLDDERFLRPFVEGFNTKMGRPTVPVERYLRLMYLKFRYGLGYESLVNEVRDSIQWRRFCRISLCDPVPHATTLVKLTKRYGPEVVDELNRLLVDKAREEKLVRGATFVYRGIAGQNPGFNPRAHVGRDTLRMRSILATVFQPARPRGARLHRDAIKMIRKLFQPARPRGARQV